jgi:uncharacterized protein YjbI with pentapeptide repeats
MSRNGLVGDRPRIISSKSTRLHQFLIIDSMLQDPQSGIASHLLMLQADYAFDLRGAIAKTNGICGVRKRNLGPRLEQSWRVILLRRLQGNLRIKVVPMADPDLLRLLHQGTDAWNDWRKLNPSAGKLDLSAAMDIRGMNLGGADFHGVDLRWSALIGMNLSGCNFRSADLMGSNLRDSNCMNADFTHADLQWVQFNRTDLRRATLQNATLRGAVFIRTDASGADFCNSRVFGVSVWSLVTDADTRQTNLVITTDDQSTVTVDDIEVAQFVYLLLNREKLRNVLDTITSKAVLVLGRFTSERKGILEAIAQELRRHNLLPIIFDFEKSAATLRANISETV